MNLFRGIDFKNEPLLSVINLILYIVLIIVIYFLLLKVTGHSPLFETILATLIVGLITNTFRYEFLLGKFVGEHNEFKNNVKESFKNMKSDINEIKVNIKK